MSYSAINAKSEEAAKKPGFRSAMKHRHCLVLADGYYECGLNLSRLLRLGQGILARGHVDDCLIRRLGFQLAVKQQRQLVRAPRTTVADAPEGNAGD